MFERKTIRAFEVTALDELKSKGMEVSALPESEVAKLRETTKAVRDKFTEEFGQSSAFEMMSELERVRSGKP
jgi:TRAP-type transport system periplasmic protein